MARYVTIRNPISGAGRAGKLFRRIGAELKAHGHQVEHLESHCREDAIRIARELDPTIDGLISIGGDGTHNSVINGLMGRPVPLMPVPAGTENVLCKGIGIPADEVVIREMLEVGRTRSFDVGLANGQAFTVMSGVGFDAKITGEVHAHRHGPISRWWYFWPTVRNLFFYRWPHLTVEVDGQRVVEGAAFAVIGNMRMYADRLHVCDLAKPDDGLLDICVFTRPGCWRLASYFVSIRLGRHLKRSDIVYRQGKRIVVRPTEQDVPFQIDGDAIGVAPVEYTVSPQSVQMFVP